MKQETVWFIVAACGLSGCVAELTGDEVTDAVPAELSSNELRYEQQNITTAPGVLDFWIPAGISNPGDVFGTGYACTDDFSACSFQILRVDEAGHFSVVAEDAAASDVNARGEVGGCIILDDLGFLAQAAVFDRHARVDLVPPRPGEVTSCVNHLSDAGTAVVTSVDELSEATAYVLRHGEVTLISVPNRLTVDDVNDRGVVVGRLATDAGQRGYSFDSRTRTTVAHEPLLMDADAWALGVNRRGEVLGYSFVFNGRERIGVWNRRNEFETYFVEGTLEYPTISNRLIWNEPGLIVVSETTDGNTYLIPEPGVRLNLQELVQDGTVPPTLSALAINDRGDFVAIDTVDLSTYVFRRLRH